MKERPEPAIYTQGMGQSYRAADSRALQIKLCPGFLEGSHLLTCQRRGALLLVDVRKVLNDNTWTEISRGLDNVAEAHP